MSERELERLRQRAGARKGKKGKNIKMKLKMVVSSKDDSVFNFSCFVLILNLKQIALIISCYIYLTRMIV